MNIQREVIVESVPLTNQKYHMLNGKIASPRNPLDLMLNLGYQPLNPFEIVRYCGESLQRRDWSDVPITSNQGVIYTGDGVKFVNILDAYDQRDITRSNGKIYLDNKAKVQKSVLVPSDKIIDMRERSVEDVRDFTRELSDLMSCEVDFRKFQRGLRKLGIEKIFFNGFLKDGKRPHKEGTIGVVKVDKRGKSLDFSFDSINTHQKYAFLTRN